MNLHKVITLALLFFGLSLQAGELTVDVSTESTEARFAPSHILAIWVAGANGNWIKTLVLHGENYLKHLRTFSAATKGTFNTADAITGATLKKHQDHTVKWDGKSVEGKALPDGIYQVFVEFTEKNAQGPVAMIEFEKGKKVVKKENGSNPNIPIFNITWNPK